jgi:hypothetical protein
VGWAGMGIVKIHAIINYKNARKTERKYIYFNNANTK